MQFSRLFTPFLCLLFSSIVVADEVQIIGYAENLSNSQYGGIFDETLCASETSEAAAICARLKYFDEPNCTPQAKFISTGPIVEFYGGKKDEWEVSCGSQSYDVSILAAYGCHTPLVPSKADLTSYPSLNGAPDYLTTEKNWHCIDPNSIEHPEEDLGIASLCGDSQTPQLVIGNPINIANGNKLLARQDYQSVHGLDFNRYYNSDKTVQKHFFPGQALPMGQHWRHSYQRELQVTNDGMIYHHGDGQGEYFKKINAFPVLYQSPYGNKIYQPENNYFEYIYQRSDGSQEWYHIYNGLTRLVSQSGHVTTVSESFAQIDITHPTGQTLVIILNDDGQVTGLTKDNATLATYDYDDQGRLVGIHYGDNTREQYHYEDGRHPFALTGITDTKDIRVSTYAYDAKGRAILSTKANGVEKNTVSYQGNQRIVTDAFDETRTFTFKNQNARQKLQDIEGSHCPHCAQMFAGFDYDDNGYITGQTDYLGQNISQQYDLEGQITQSKQLGLETSYDWQDGLLAGLDNDLVNISNQYNGQRQLSQRVILDKVTNKTTTFEFSYSTAGLLQSVSRNGELQVKHDYNRLGNLIASTNAKGQRTQYQAHHHDGQWLTQTTANQSSISRQFDKRQRLTSLNHQGIQRRWTHTPTGQIKTDTQGEVVTTYHYDAIDRLVGVEKANEAMVITRDALGNITKQELKDETGKVTFEQSTSYTPQNTPQQTTGAEGQKQSYQTNAQGQIIQQQNAYGDKTHFITNELGQITQHIDASGERTYYTYDAYGRVKTVKTADNLETTYQYSGLGQVLKESHPSFGTREYVYDNAGRLSTEKHADITVTRQYDSLDRIKLVKGQNQQRHFNYDENTNDVGQLTSTITETSLGEIKTNYQYTPIGQLKHASISLEGKIFNTAYQYADSGEVTAVTYPSGHIIAKTLDGAGRPQSIQYNGQVIASNIEYLPFGPVKGLTLGNGLTVTKGFDKSYRLTTQSIQDSTSYQYDLSDNLIKKDNDSYLYTKNHRLRKEPNQTYSYQGNGHRASEVGKAYQYNDKGQVTQVGGEILTYDVAGRLTNKGQMSYRYDDFGRLAEATNQSLPSCDGQSSDKVIAQYAYDNFDRRVLKYSYINQDKGCIEAKPNKTLFIYNPNHQLIAEANAEGQILAEYIYLQGAPLAIIKDNQVYYFINEPQGHPDKVYDQQQNLVWHKQSTAFGANGAEASQIIKQPLRFPGQYQDTETGLYYNHHRYYDPELGRYTKPDPLGIAGGNNLYAYAENQPFRYVDIQGKSAVTIDFWGYPIDTGYGFKVDAIHAGVLLIDDETGLTNYYEYGRYTNQQDPRLIGAVLPGKGGNIRKITVSDVVIGKNGIPTDQSLQRVYSELAFLSGHGIMPSTSFYRNVDFHKAKQYVLDIANNPNRSEYSLFSNNCIDFANDVIIEGM